MGEPKGSTIRHIRLISLIRPISPKDTLPHLGGIERGFFPPLGGTEGGFSSPLGGTEGGSLLGDCMGLQGKPNILLALSVVMRATSSGVVP